MEEPDIEAAMAAQASLEARVKRHLDSTLGPRGFGLAPQGFGLAPDGRILHEVIYESEPAYYERRYPVLRSRFQGEVACIDLRIDLGDGTELHGARLEVDEVNDLLTEIGGSLPSVAGAGLDAQLTQLAEILRIVMDTFENMAR